MHTRAPTPIPPATTRPPAHAVPPGTPPAGRQPPARADAIADQEAIEYASWLHLLRHLGA